MEKIRGFEVVKGFEDKEINLPERKTKYSAGYDIEIKKGEAIGQALFQKYLITDNDKAEGKRMGGFGSTRK